MLYMVYMLVLRYIASPYYVKQIKSLLNTLINCQKINNISKAYFYKGFCLIYFKLFIYTTNINETSMNFKNKTF